MKTMYNMKNLYKKTIDEFKKDSLIDLHTHSTFSDGELTPNELLQHAYNNNVGTIALTDHDTILGVKELKSSNKYIKKFVDVIPGIELSAKVETGQMHILGYGIDINNSKLNERLSKVRNHNVYHIISLLHQIKNDYNILFETEDLIELISANKNINRIDLARLFVKYNYTNTIQEALKKYLNDANEKVKTNGKGIAYQECIELIKGAGGIPVLAHPNSLELNNIKLLELIKEMVLNGLQGIECYHSSFSEEESKFYLDIANKFDLLISGGSDFHGESTKRGVKIGTGKNNLHIKKLTILDKLKK